VGIGPYILFDFNASELASKSHYTTSSRRRNPTCLSLCSRARVGKGEIRMAQIFALKFR
jgi:hypothetical protein